MKRFLKSLPIIGDMLKLFNRCLWELHVWRVDPGRLLKKILRKHNNLFVLQIGSNDGMNGDPIFAALERNATWRALLVEPVPYLFDKLKKNYAKNNRVQFANVAIAEEVGVSTFYFLDASVKTQVPELPTWFDQLGSFNRNHITGHLGASLDQYVVSTEIRTVNFSKLLQDYGVTKIDVLHIDTEGYDWKILRQLDLNTFRPKVILFEYKHLQASEKMEALAFLQPNYQVSDLDVSGDYLCELI